MKKFVIYLSVMLTAIVAMAVLLNCFPRSVYSELERRDLNTFPEFSWERLASGDFTTAVSAWYSDSEPFRDVFMSLSMDLRKARALNVGSEEEQITFIAGDTDPEPEAVADPEMLDEMAMSDPFEDMPEGPLGADPDADGDLDQKAKIANHGILIVGSAPNARALMAYRGKAGGDSYANVINTYKNKFGGDVNIYCMVIPTAVEFYCPEKAKSATNSEKATIDNLHSKLLPTVRKVDLLPVLSQHTDEAIYLRTDHHWAPRGAYYAARELARVAGVPFMDMSTYDEHVTHRFVGTMYGFSKDVSIKNSPEDFYYWTPNGVTYTVTYTVYDIDSEYRVIGEHKPYTSNQFFFHFKDGSGSAYCTFMGGDTKITKVVTSTKNGRRLIILKDSFGNALPGWLFGSFEEIHVIDGRYFTKNMVDYVVNNKITDIVFCNNVFKAYAGGRQYLRFLEQRGSGIYVPKKPATVDSVAPAPADTVTPVSAPAENPVAEASAAEAPAETTETPAEPSANTPE